jgi:hypothetical protein
MAARLPGSSSHIPTSEKTASFCWAERGWVYLSRRARAQQWDARGRYERYRLKCWPTPSLPDTASQPGALAILAQNLKKLGAGDLGAADTQWCFARCAARCVCGADLLNRWWDPHISLGIITTTIFGTVLACVALLLLRPGWRAELVHQSSVLGRLHVRARADGGQVWSGGVRPRLLKSGVRPSAIGYARQGRGDRRSCGQHARSMLPACLRPPCMQGPKWAGRAGKRLLATVRPGSMGTMGAWAQGALHQGTPRPLPLQVWPDDQARDKA